MSNLLFHCMCRRVVLTVVLLCNFGVGLCDSKPMKVSAISNEERTKLLIVLPIHAASEKEFRKQGFLNIRVHVGDEKYNVNKIDWVLGEAKFGGVMGLKQFCIPLGNEPSDLEKLIISQESLKLEVFSLNEKGNEKILISDVLPIVVKRFPTKEESEKLRKLVLGVDKGGSK